MLNFTEFIDGIEHFLEKTILFSLIDKLIEEKAEEILLKVLILIKVLLYGKLGTPKALTTQIISRLTSLLQHQNCRVFEKKN